MEIQISEKTDPKTIPSVSQHANLAVWGPIAGERPRRQIELDCARRALSAAHFCLPPEFFVPLKGFAPRLPLQREVHPAVQLELLGPIQAFPFALLEQKTLLHGAPEIIFFMLWNMGSFWAAFCFKLDDADRVFTPCQESLKSQVDSRVIWGRRHLGLENPVTPFLLFAVLTCPLREELALADNPDIGQIRPKKYQNVPQ